MVFQGAMNAFNPVLQIRGHMHDTMRAHSRCSKKEIEEQGRRSCSAWSGWSRSG